jgi:hypothetical protein
MSRLPDRILGEVTAAQSGRPGVAPGLERNLLRFVGVLRALGLAIGSGEVLDALSALACVDLLDRGQVKTALGATLAKDERAVGIFSHAFDLFFVVPEEAEARAGARREAEEARAARLLRSEEELTFQGQPLSLSDEQKDAYAKLSEAQQERLQEFLARSSSGHGVDSSFTPLIEHIVRGHLDRWRRNTRGGERNGPRTGDEAMDDVVRGVLAGSGAGGDPVLFLDMQDIAEADMPRARALLRRLAKRLATRLMRRYRKDRRGRTIDFRRTLRASLGYGGIPVELRFRRKKVLKPRIVLVCDVSGSMARYSSFILQFTYGLSKVVRDIEVFLFAEDLEHISARLRAAGGLERSVASIVEGSAVWGKGTNLAAALERLAEEHGQQLSSDALLVLVSDTKTLSAGEASRLLAGMRRKVRDIIWLNPVPAREWGELPTVSLFAPHARMFECNTLSDLEGVLRRTFVSA